MTLSKRPLGNTFNTLAVGGTGVNPNTIYHTLYGSGTSKESFKKFPKRLLISKRLALACISICEENGDKEFIKSYWNTFHCFTKIKTHGDKVFGYYCKNRICNVCSQNRKAILIRKYFPIVSAWEKPYFLTLTRKSVHRAFLGFTVKYTIEAFSRIVKRLNKRASRGKGPKIVCIRSIESNFNPIDKTYNPHFHIICKNREIAKLLNVEWLKEWGKDVANPFAQDFQKVKDKEQNLIEVIKYATKVWTDPDMKKGKQKTKDPVIYAAAIHEIVKAFSKHKAIVSYGINFPKVAKTANVQMLPDSAVKCWSFELEHIQYVEEKTGETIYKERHLPSAKLIHLVNERVDSNTT